MMPWIGAVVAALVIAYHLFTANRAAAELKLLAVAMLIGLLWDSMLVYWELLQYPSGMIVPYAAPYWIIIMWALFATTLNRSLGWLQQKVGLSIALGALAGPLAYYAGANLGALTFLDQEQALIALALGWGLFTPVLVALSGRLNQARSLSEI
jgi:hypothetical protein